MKLTHWSTKLLNRKMLSCKLLDKKQNKDILKSKSFMTTHLVHNFTNQLKRRKDLLKKSEKLITERKASSLSVMQETLSSHRRDSVLLNSKNSSKNSTNIDELKRLMREERCPQDFWQLSSIKHFEKKLCKNLSSRKIGLSNRLRTHSMSIWVKNSKDFMKSKCKSKPKQSI